MPYTHRESCGLILISIAQIGTYTSPPRKMPIASSLSDSASRKYTRPMKYGSPHFTISLMTHANPSYAPRSFVSEVTNGDRHSTTIGRSNHRRRNDNSRCVSNINAPSSTPTHVANIFV